MSVGGVPKNARRINKSRNVDDGKSSFKGFMQKLNSIAKRPSSPKELLRLLIKKYIFNTKIIYTYYMYIFLIFYTYKSQEHSVTTKTTDT